MTTLLAFLAQTDPAMTNQEFWLAVIDKTTPIVLELVKTLGILVAAVAAYLTWKRQAKTDAKLGQVHDQLNGRMTELVEAQAARAHAEGRLEEHEKVPPPVIVVQPQVPPIRTGQERTRASDRGPDPPEDKPC